MILVLILALFLAGCKSYKSDLFKTFNKYLKYSLGDFKSDKRIASGPFNPPFGSSDRYTEWTLKYEDDNGKDKTFVFNNAYENISKNHKMGIEVYRQANNDCSDEIGENICSKYFDYISDEKKIPIEDLPATYILVNGENIIGFSASFYEDCIDNEHGLKLSSITANELKDKWKGKFNILIITGEAEEEELKAILAKTKSLLKDFSKYLNLDTATASIRYSSYIADILYNVTYDNNKSTYNIEDVREERAKSKGENKTPLKSNKYIDGHKEKIKTYIVNNKKLVWLDPAKYDIETKMYYLGLYINLLKALGIEIEEDRAFNYRWQIGDDIFEEYYKYPRKILKNNLEIAYPKQVFQGRGYGLNVKEFELISNTTVVIDEKNETVIINKN
ncbi:hypothetical protein E9840_03600 [Tissierella creatinini]|nr:hypothetical protein E9840_03600 [Tissierella creatinini]TJX60547.1 hypothetical protein E8P77_20090 [Soehngenia saccharolytica]